jgi:arabinogalactan oligomer/maltooligosaccharide transport system substrate-binding protein
MVKRTKIIATIMATMVMAGAFVGCGAKTTNEGDKVVGTNDTTITVWSHLKQNEVDAITPMAEEWAAKKGVKVKVVVDEGDMQGFIQAANSSKGPDIMFGLAHDNLGTFNKAGLLAEVPSDLLDKNAYASEQVLDAVTVGGKMVGVPLSQETIALFYNKDKVKEVPATMEELVDQAKELGFKYDATNFYMSFGFIAAGGGYVFGGENGNLDPTDIGMNNSGAVEGYEFLNNLFTSGLIPADINGDLAKSAFLTGETAFYISGPWDVAAMNEGNVNFGVAPIPTLNGNNIKTFMGVQSAFVSSKSKNQELAWDLVKYLAETTGETLFETGNRIPVLKSVLEGEKFTSNELMVHFSEQAKFATPMPNIPEVSTMWDPGANNIKLMVAGDLSPKAAADATVEQIKSAIALQ